MYDLGSGVRGRVLGPGDPGFDEARALWNTRFDRKPAVIVQCADAADVATAIGYAGEHQLELSVKGGGHSYAANTVAEGSLLIDLTPLDSTEVDPDARTAVVGAGVTCAQLDAATQAHGLATPTPTVSSVGVIGAALGGGSGWLSRKHGLLADNVVSYDVVTADERQLSVSGDSDPDLFWALRGGGGNFGVVTSATLDLHPVGPPVLSGQIIYPFDETGGMLRFFRRFMDEAPNEFQCFPFMFRVPPIELFPEETHGTPVLDFVVFHLDPGATDFVQPLRELGQPILDFVAPTPYADVQQAFDANLPNGYRYYSKAHNLESISDELIEVVVEFVPQMKGEFTACYFEPLGGAVGERDVEATPYGGREAGSGFHCLAGWIDDSQDETVMSWASELHQAVAPHATGGVYVNLIADDEDHRVPAAYGPNHQRLSELKSEWDPENLFSNNYNIRPAG